jgi:hypothetical protein
MKEHSKSLPLNDECYASVGVAQRTWGASPLQTIRSKIGLEMTILYSVLKMLFLAYIFSPMLFK